MQASIRPPYEVRLVRKPATRRQRRARTLKVLAALVLAALFLVLAPRVVEMMSHTDVPPAVTYTVDYGDNLWNIASRFNQDGDVRDLIGAIKQVNHLETATVQPGQVLVIPKVGF